MGRLAATEPVVWTLQDHFWTPSIPKSLKGPHRFRDVRRRRVIVQQRRSSLAQLQSTWRDTRALRGACQSGDASRRPVGEPPSNFRAGQSHMARRAPIVPQVSPLPACGERSPDERALASDGRRVRGASARQCLPIVPLTRFASRKSARKSTPDQVGGRLSPRKRGEVGQAACLRVHVATRHAPQPYAIALPACGGGLVPTGRRAAPPDGRLRAGWGLPYTARQQE